MRIIALFYALLCLVGCALQRRLIYFPTKLAPVLADRMAAERGFTPWRNQAGEIIGWHLPAGGTSTGAVLIVYGNAGSALDRGYIAKPIHDAGPVDVFVLEYPGYGARPGSPSQKSFLDAADEAFGRLTNHSSIYVVSESLGTGVAAHLARMNLGRVSGLMLLAPYNDLTSVGKHQMPLLPVRLILWDKFPAAEWLAEYRGPVSFLLAGADEVIPTRLGQKLHDGYAGPKRLLVIAGARHNDVAEQPPEWWRAVFGFWREHAAPTGR